mmetsp:Transcript_118461/g.382457  ORF Transcript_118461/g.382457 Transcript_118461/m.382457 type:complete len:154 (-) Transcript_118461:57-518(-)
MGQPLAGACCASVVEADGEAAVHGFGAHAALGRAILASGILCTPTPAEVIPPKYAYRQEGDCFVREVTDDASRPCFAACCRSTPEPRSAAQAPATQHLSKVEPGSVSSSLCSGPGRGHEGGWNSPALVEELNACAQGLSLELAPLRTGGPAFA